MMKFGLLLLIIMNTAFAAEVHYLARSPRALLMGDAFTALADDEYTLFYNPAVLGRKSGLRLHPINMHLATLNPSKGIFDPIGEMDRFQDFPSEPAEIVDRIMGFPVYFKIAGIPTVKFGPFALSLFASSTTSLFMSNSTHPTIDIDQRLDRGFIFGYAYTLGSGGSSTWGKVKKETKHGGKLSVGASVKQMNRTSIKGNYDVFSTGLLGDIDGLQANTGVLRSLFGYGKGAAWGYDAGLDYSYSFNDSSMLSAGLAVMDIFDTRFDKSEGSQGVVRQDMLMSAGIAWKQDFFLFDYSLSLDIRPLNQKLNFYRRVHAGFEAGIPGFHFMGGFSEGYISYGVRTTIWPFTLIAGFYGVEIGTTYREKQGKRFILYLSLLDFSFDG